MFYMNRRVLNTNSFQIFEYITDHINLINIHVHIKLNKIARKFLAIH